LSLTFLFLEIKKRKEKALKIETEIMGKEIEIGINSTIHVYGFMYIFLNKCLKKT